MKEGQHMARNKYPEVTVEKILDAAQRLFLTKGYEATTIQDIVDELGGLTKGAVYHHFKSKEEIISAVSDRMFYNNNPFEAVKARSDLNGLEKLREATRLNQVDTDRNSLTLASIPAIKNPRILVEMIESNLKVLTPYLRELIDEGNRDGSIHTEYSTELAELLPLLTSLWLLPSVYPGDRTSIRRKFRFIGDMLEKMGLPLVDDSISRLIDEFVSQIPESFYQN